MKEHLKLLKTFLKLGVLNSIFVFLHRFLLKVGFYKIRYPIELNKSYSLVDSRKVHDSIEFDSDWFGHAKWNCLNDANDFINGKIKLFGVTYKSNYLFFNGTENKKFFKRSFHWSCCRVFADEDIKLYWEPSRFAWAPLLARAWRFSKDEKYLNTLKNSISRWNKINPFNKGLNWMCGQEVSVRLINILQTFYLLDYPNIIPKLSKDRRTFIENHLKRINSTLGYAKAQNNNHIISEAAALFIGGNLIKNKKFSDIGRKELERAVRKLIMRDGSFSQYSINYHRMVIDTLSQVEIWRRSLDLEEFSLEYQKCCLNSTFWLNDFTDYSTGKAPNLGANDGSFCYQLHSQSYIDFRPTIQLASILFNRNIIFNEGPWNEQLLWYKLVPKYNSLYKQSKLKYYQNGGFIIIRPSINNWALFNLPEFKFRPSQADPFHFDLWYKGENILRDGGSYSYNNIKEEMNYFSGIKSHNTIQIDYKEPMPKLSRFLWGDWLSIDNISIDNYSDLNLISIISSYKYLYGFHKRKLEYFYDQNKWVITDNVYNFKINAILRWRLNNVKWKFEQDAFYSDLAVIKINSSKNSFRSELVKGYESIFYNSKKSLPTIEFEIRKCPCQIVTEIFLK